MTIDLAAYESGTRHAGDFARDLEALQLRLAHIQAAHIAQNAQSVILLEGWDAGGKGGIIRAACAPLDPRYFEVYPIGAPSDEERGHHFLWRFWKRLPAKRQIALFDRSWYGRVAVERVEGFATEAEWQRGFDEINEFEARLTENGIALVKLFVHVTQATQDERLAARLDDPWKRWKTGAEDYRNRSKRADYLNAYHEMFARTDTRWAPWRVVDGNRKKPARIAALTHIADALEARLDMTPPAADPAVVELARAAFGYVPAAGEGGADE